jgi:hypothetical protein
VERRRDRTYRHRTDELARDLPTATE